jgi:hypothetical protein
MLPTTEKDAAAIEKAKTLQNVPWGDEYERMISGMMYVRYHYALSLPEIEP